MQPVLTPTEMRAVDAASSVPEAVLIERAGAAVARHAIEVLGGAYGRRVVVLAGKGNNGADGRAAAVRLRARGVRVQVIEALDASDPLPEADLVIDAAYGTGFRGEHHAPEVGDTPVLAVDIPSGVDGLTGEVRGRALAAVRTVTFAALKPGLLMEPGRGVAGEIAVADIGLDVGAPAASVVQRIDVAAWLPRRRRDAHKWHSSVLIVAGSSGMTGAAHLSARAAQRAGSGMVRLGSPGVADDPGRPTESVGLALPAAGWAPIVLASIDRFHALVIGPGLGAHDTTAAGVRAVLAGSQLPAVVDGDALSGLGEDASAVLVGRPATVLTPHDGEHERLTGQRPGSDRIDDARRLAATTGAVVLLKGPTTVVADPGGQVRIVTVGDARLATAGTGDVLSGIVGALLAQGLDPLEAAAAGAWLHATAGALGPAEGLVASDLVARLPLALASVRG